MVAAQYAGSNDLVFWAVSTDKMNGMLYFNWKRGGFDLTYSSCLIADATYCAQEFYCSRRGIPPRIVTALSSQRRGRGLTVDGAALGTGGAGHVY